MDETDDNLFRFGYVDLPTELPTELPAELPEEVVYLPAELPVEDVAEETPITTSSGFNKYVPINFGLPSSNLNWKLAQFLTIDFLTRTYIGLPQQIDAMADIINWDIISTRELPGPLFVKHANKINWAAFLQNGKPKEINFLIDVKDKLIENIDVFYDSRLRKRYYNTPFLLVFPNLIDWRWAAKNVQLEEYVLLKFWDKMPINRISKYQQITDTIALEKKDQINWQLVSRRPLSEKIMNLVADQLNWDTICRRQRNLSEDFLTKNADRLRWRIIARYQLLTPAFIRKYARKLDMALISQYQDLPIDFVREFENQLDFSLLAKNKHYNKSDTIQVLSNGRDWFVIDQPLIGRIPKVSYLSLPETDI